MYEITAQLVGVLGMICSFTAFQCKKHKNIMLLRSGDQIFFGVQFLMLGQYTGLAMNSIGLVRNLLFAYQVEKDRSTRAAQIIFSFFFAVAGLFTFNNIIDLGTVVSKIITTFTYGMKNTTKLRCFTLPTHICWLIYCVYCNSVAGMISESFCFISLFTAIIRFDLIPYLKSKKTERV